MKTISDNQIMLLVKEGHTEMVGTLYERYKDILFRFFFNLMHNASLSEDLVQNVFLRILKYKTKFKGEGEFKYWLFAIARNVHTDHYRKKGNQAKADIDQWPDQIDTAPNQLVQIERREEIHLLHKALKLLDPEKREVIVLSRLHGMKYKEIAQMLNLSEGAVKVRVFRGMRALKKIYEKLEKTS